MKMYKKRIGCLVLAGAVTASLCSMSALAANYADTNGHWAESSINRWTDTGIVNGNGNGSFNPNGTMTRAEAAVMFANLMQVRRALISRTSAMFRQMHGMLTPWPSVLRRAS